MTRRRRRPQKSNGQAPAVPIAHVAPTVEPAALSRSVERLPFRHAPACDARHAQTTPCNDGLREAARRASPPTTRRYECARCHREWPLYALACRCGSRDCAEVAQMLALVLGFDTSRRAP